MPHHPKPFFRTGRGWYVQLGKTQIRLCDGPKDAATEQEAWRAYHELMAAGGRPPCSAPAASAGRTDGPTMGEVFERFLDWCQRNRSPRTYEWSRKHIQKFCDSLTPSARLMPVRDLRPYHLVKWADSHDTWGPNQRRGAIVAVQRPLHWAAQLGYIEVNPVRGVEKPQPKRREHYVGPADLAELRDRYREGDAFRDLLEFLWEPYPIVVCGDIVLFGMSVVGAAKASGVEVVEVRQCPSCEGLNVADLSLKSAGLFLAAVRGRRQSDPFDFRLIAASVYASWVGWRDRRPPRGTPMGLRKVREEQRQRLIKEAFSRSQRSLERDLALLSLRPKLRDAVRHRKLPERHIEAAAKLPGHVQERLAAQLAGGVPRRDFPSAAVGLKDFRHKNVLLLGEGLDQARSVAQFLPGWPVVSGLDDDTAGNVASDADVAAGVVATALGAAKLSGDRFDVVVRADPGTGLPPLPTNWLETAEYPARALLVIDVEDRGHHLAALWARERRRAYLGAGWHRAGRDADVAAWERFEALITERRERP